VHLLVLFTRNLNTVCGTICKVHVIQQASLCGNISALHLGRFPVLASADRPVKLMGFFYSLMSVQANTIVAAQIDSIS